MSNYVQFLPLLSANIKRKPSPITVFCACRFLYFDLYRKHQNKVCHSNDSLESNCWGWTLSFLAWFWFYQLFLAELQKIIFPSDLSHWIWDWARILLLLLRCLLNLILGVLSFGTGSRDISSVFVAWSVSSSTILNCFRPNSNSWSTLPPLPCLWSWPWWRSPCWLKNSQRELLERSWRGFLKTWWKPKKGKSKKCVVLATFSSNVNWMKVGQHSIYPSISISSIGSVCM